MSAREIVAALRGSWHGSYGMVCCPVHQDRGPSLSISDGEDGRLLVHCFAGCDPVEILRTLRDRGLSGQQAEPLEPRPTKGNDASDRIRAALDLWRETRPASGTVVERYLRRRGLNMLPPDFQFHPALKLDDHRAPAMVALMRDILTNEPCGIHRTFLDPQGHKLGRKMLGRAKGACVKLANDADVLDGLGIAEGIETTLAVQQMGWAPVWACLSAGSIASFPVLPGVDAITVFADRDKNGAGERAARACCARWREAGREAPIILPDREGDFNDAIGAAA